MLPDIVTVRLEKVEPHSKKGFFAKLKDFAPVLTGIATLALSVASFVFLQSREHEKQEIATAEARQKALSALGESGAKREVAAITLAAYGTTALPTIRILLSGSEDDPPMRSFGILVVQRWLDAGVPTARERILGELSNYAKSDSKSLRLGTYSALEQISDRLTREEDRVVLALLVERFGSSDGQLETDTDIAGIACKLLNKFNYSETRTALKNIAKSDAVAQALVSYGNVLNQNLPPDSCQSLLDDLNAVKLSDPPVSPTVVTNLATMKQRAGQKCK